MEDEREPESQPQYLSDWADVANLISSLLWSRYGYRLPDMEPPDWYEGALVKAKTAARLARPALTHARINGKQEPEAYVGTCLIWDEANPWIGPYETTLRSSSEHGARERFSVQSVELAKLHAGDINALIHYREHGQAVAPDWYPDPLRYWLSADYRPERHRGRKAAP